ncbi:DNA polymerase alpha, subunit B [Cryphonectria parasitica EP155]|uniref:DNA polymerase alpha subunit B n=1 Tax=Cryphonectria parasitica (strain ATCC 38755 / EP155) TaxID=660469 RepID=A0A9P4XSU7_CRYP1|nr:DNA polymerase alpha, subunit B [Cryphonectria parasitica EP155]KAF3760318.1 DNA polymerase alpha, subunit B [Cryphonectria parasitica EP155]
MANSTVAELNERFGAGDKGLGQDVVVEMQSIMRLHNLSPEDLYFKWESYCIKLDMNETQPSFERMNAFKQDLQDALEKTTRTQVHTKSERRTGATPRMANRGGDVFGMIDGLIPGTPATARKSATKKKETPVSRVKSEHAGSSPDHKSPNLKEQLDSMGALPPSSFNDRQNPGEVIEVLNSQLPAAEHPIAPFGEPRIKLTAASDQKKLTYKPLGMKLSEASEILDDRIDDFLKMVRDHHQLEDDAFGSAATQSTTEIVAVGRIASDSLEGRLNAASLVLETSRRTGGGLRIPLNMDKIKKYQFFPGQIVALRGSNTSGHNFTVTEVLEIPLLPNAASSPSALSAHRQKLLGGPDAMDTDSEPMPLNIIYAAGPYTADDNLDFEPLHQLCTVAADSYADALVLTGPFIDVDHPLIASGDFDLPEEATVDPDTATMATAFKYMISPALNRLVAANPNVTILLVPSTRDIIDKHVSWPQDAFPRKELGLHKSVKIVGNPMTLSINEMVLAISSQDVLWELKGEEVVSRPAPTTDLLARLSRYLIEQRHYFPVYPPMDRGRYPKTGTAEGVQEGAMLDVSYLKLGEMVGGRPDVLIVPSALPPFAKVVESVLVINPGYLSKRRGAGTYARLSLYPPSLSEIEDSGESMMAHKIYDRARVEMTRI